MTIYLDPLHLKLGGAGVGSGGVNAVLVGDNFPELGSDLVTALAGLKMHDFSHCDWWLCD